jgi:hypothetical protein
MSSANCPFSIFPKKEDLDSIRRKDRYITIDIPLKPSDPNSQKITHEYHKLNSTEVEDILKFFSRPMDVKNIVTYTASVIIQPHNVKLSKNNEKNIKIAIRTIKMIKITMLNVQNTTRVLTQRKGARKITTFPTMMMRPMRTLK